MVETVDLPDKKTVYYAGYKILNRIHCTILFAAMIVFGEPIMRHPIIISILVLLSASSLYGITQPFIMLTDSALFTRKFLNRKAKVDWSDISIIRKKKRWKMESLEIITNDGKSVQIELYEMFKSSRKKLVAELQNRHIKLAFD